jgi:glycosyltransferase involved in cell wall biosynthesis
MHLTLFFTRGNSLAKWHAIGSLQREIAFYQGLQSQNIQVSLITYGGPGEESFLVQEPGFDILYNRWNFPLIIYEWLMPWLFGKSSDLLKTNQVKGAHIALIAGILWRKPVIVRQGYSWSNTLSKEEKLKFKAALVRLYESAIFKFALHIVVTTLSMKDELSKRYPRVERHISVVPNYVDTDVFKPNRDQERSSQVIYVGRFAEEKNIIALIDAVSSIGVPLKMIGTGPLEQFIKQRASQSEASITFLGTIPNHLLPHELNQASIFVLPSLYEGHPKALLEAMSCGLAVIGSNVDGIRELIQPGETGWLCQIDSASIAKAIQTLLNNPDLCRYLGQNARTYMLKNFSLKKITEQEIDLYNRLLPSETNHGLVG